MGLKGVVCLAVWPGQNCGVVDSSQLPKLFERLPNSPRDVASSPEDGLILSLHLLKSPCLLLLGSHLQACWMILQFLYEWLKMMR